MKPKISSFILTWVMIVVSVVGTALSIWFTTDTRWTQWHLSRLGEGGHLSSAIFNLTASAAAMLLVAVGVLVARDITAITRQAHERWLATLFIMAGILWCGVAAFPFDRFQVIHNVFGYGSSFVIMACMVGLRKIYPRVSLTTFYVGVLSSIITALLMAGFLLTHFTTLLLIEVFGYVLLFAWLLLLTRETSHAARP